MRNSVKAVAIFGIAALIVSAEAWSAGRDTVMLSPATTLWATRGLSQTTSAETMGAGRLTVNLTGTWYSQERGFLNAAWQGSDITTGIAAISFGVNPYIDIFASAAGYGVLAGDSSSFGQGYINAESALVIRR